MKHPGQFVPTQVVPKLSQRVRRTYVPMINEGTLTCIVLSVAWALAFCVDAVTDMRMGNSCPDRGTVLVRTTLTMSAR